MSLMRCFASVVLFGLCVGIAYGQDSGGGIIAPPPPPPPAVNGIKFDAPPKDGKNPDSPVEQAVTAKGTITTAAGWTCTKYEFVIKDGLIDVKDSGSKDNPGGAWSFASQGKCTSGNTHSVSVKAYFKETATNKTDEKSVAQTVLVK